MALHHFPLWLNSKISFYKLMGSGKNGTFDKQPDWQQWALICVATDEIQVQKGESLYGAFIAKWYRLFNCEVFTLYLQPIEGHGTWDGKKVFGNLAPKSAYEGQVAILTRATIRVNKLKYFWENVAPVADQMHTAKGFRFSAGIGEIPWVKQATFSVWDSKDDMIAFAYGMKIHAEVIQKTRKQKWYSEDMFTRFRIMGHSGTLRGKDPLGAALEKKA